MAGSVSKLCERMRYWCEEANLGYDQSNRWDIRVGGECDCSSLVYWCLWEAGFLPEKPTWGNTATLSVELTKRGWKRIAPKGNPQVGDILLNDVYHVAVCTAPGIMSYASIDENGNASGGQAGDQTGRETRTVSGFAYARGWDCYLRYKDSEDAFLPTGTGGKVKVFMFGYVNKQSSVGNPVKVCQAALNVRNNAGLVVDGSCGPKTVAAIRAWQRIHGLEVDGSCGPLTWQSLLTA